MVLLEKQYFVATFISLSVCLSCNFNSSINKRRIIFNMRHTINNKQFLSAPRRMSIYKYIQELAKSEISLQSCVSVEAPREDII